MVLACYRAIRLAIHLLAGLALAAAVAIDRRRRLQPERLMSWWCGVLLDIFGIRLSRHGAPHPGPRLTVANHVSWLDIAIIGASEPTRFVAKSEIQRWPVAGWLADAAGTFYIRRGKGGARPLLEQLIPHLADGGNVTLFPEGTTTRGDAVQPFHPRLFAAAQQTGVPVQPVALRYADTRDGRSVAPFVDDDDLLSHILRLLRQPELAAEITYCRPLSATGLTREELAGEAHRHISDIIAPGQLQAAPEMLQPVPA